MSNPEIIVTSDYSNLRAPKLIVHDREFLNLKAKVALDLVKRWGLVAGAPDSTHENGRQSLRLMTPDEIVDRAVETADKITSRFNALGWVTVGPTWSEAVEQSQRQENEYEEQRKNKRG